MTFCQLVPMRSIPFKVVCLLGMNDGAFPANDVALSFDVMARHPRLGDRSRRDDDRQLFLEALLSARQRLQISYVGQSIHDGKALAPSVLVTELIDHVTRSFCLPANASSVGFSEHAKRMEARLLLRHPLQAFSPRYFGADADRRLFSYASGHCSGASQLSAERWPRPVFWSALQPPPPSAAEVGLSQLEAALVHPLRMFAQQRLGLYLGDDLTPLLDREPLELDHLDALEPGHGAADALARRHYARAGVAGIACARCVAARHLGRARVRAARGACQRLGARVPRARARRAAARPAVDSDVR